MLKILTQVILIRYLYLIVLLQHSWASARNLGLPKGTLSSWSTILKHCKSPIRDRCALASAPLHATIRMECLVVTGLQVGGRIWTRSYARSESSSTSKGDLNLSRSSGAAVVLSQGRGKTSPSTTVLQQSRNLHWIQPACSSSSCGLHCQSFKC